MWNPVAACAVKAVVMPAVFCFHIPQKNKLQSKARTLCQCGFDKWLLTLLIWRRLTSNVTRWGTWSPGDRLDPHFPALWLARRYPLSSDCATPARCTEKRGCGSIFQSRISFWVSQQLPDHQQQPYQYTHTHTRTIPWCAIFHILISTAWLIEKSNLVSLHVLYKCARMFFGPLFFNMHVTYTSTTVSIMAHFSCQFQICTDGWLHETLPAVR